MYSRMDFKPLILGFSPNIGEKTWFLPVFPPSPGKNGEKYPRGFSHPALVDTLNLLENANGFLENSWNFILQIKYTPWYWLLVFGTSRIRVKIVD